MKSYYPVINLLRGIATLCVCCYHFVYYSDLRGAIFPGDSFMKEIIKVGGNAVFTFFVISGFVIPLSLSKNVFKLNLMFKFILRRFIRLEIPYLLSIVLILFVGFLFAVKNNQDFVIDAKQFFFHVIYLIPFSKFPWYNIIYWTLALEFQFYLLIGVLFFFLSSTNKFILYSTLLLIGASSFIIQDNRLVFHYSTLFLTGIILFLIENKRISREIGFMLILLSTLATIYTLSLTIALFSISAVIVIYFIKVDNKYTNRLGDISYSLYLTHGLIGGNILYLFSRYTVGVSGKLMLITVAMLASLIFSYFFWKIAESPAKSLSKKVNDT